MTPSSYKMLAFRMSYKVNQGKINAIFEKKEHEPTDNLAFIAPDNIKVGAAQVTVKKYKSLTEYVHDMERYVEKAAKLGVQLLCFPHGCGLLPLMMLPNIEDVLRSFEAVKGDDTAVSDLLYPLLEHLSDFTYETFVTTFGNLAKSYGIYIMAGSAFLYDNGKMICRSYLFDEAGQIIGVQSKLHYHNKFERVMDIALDNKINIFDTKLGKIAMLIDGDAKQFECVKIAKALGANLLLCPAYARTDNLAELASFSFVQNADLYGVYQAVSMLTGERGVDYFGSSAVYAPVHITKNRDGILSKILIENEAGITSSRIDLTRLGRAPDAYTADRNTEFYKEHMLARYKRI